MHKLEAAVKIYAGLLDVPEVRKDAAEKLLGMLLHRFSQVCCYLRVSCLRLITGLGSNAVVCDR